MPTKTETANVVTKIFGYDENADLRSSAIPWIFDEWFHGDFTTNRPDDLATALGTKSLEEYTQYLTKHRQLT
ncbi:hypothetical protein [Haloarcula sp. JP-L23]|uniref:hypothetical protein n=1 Tax=Haloarcula sp. JP-L23 TaxID=2716717 RepID=UPI00140EAEFF|nr:hypothetical protein G9465_24180 [Haloarcula sp. JP-L23]